MAQEVSYKDYVSVTSNSTNYLVNPKTGRIVIFRSTTEMMEAFASCDDFIMGNKKLLLDFADNIIKDIEKLKKTSLESEIRAFYESKDTSYEPVVAFDKCIEFIRSYDKLRIITEGQLDGLGSNGYKLCDIRSINNKSIVVIGSKSYNNDCGYEIDSQGELLFNTDNYYVGLVETSWLPRTRTIEMFINDEQFTEYIESISIAYKSKDTKEKLKASAKIKEYKTLAGINLTKVIKSMFEDYKDYAVKELPIETKEKHKNNISDTDKQDRYDYDEDYNDDDSSDYDGD